MPRSAKASKFLLEVGVGGRECCLGVLNGVRLSEVVTGFGCNEHFLGDFRIDTGKSTMPKHSTLALLVDEPLSSCKAILPSLCNTHTFSLKDLAHSSNKDFTESVEGESLAGVNPSTFAETQGLTSSSPTSLLEVQPVSDPKAATEPRCTLSFMGEFEFKDGRSRGRNAEGVKAALDAVCFEPVPITCLPLIILSSGPVHVPLC
jgi:hypothetical protein